MSYTPIPPPSQTPIPEDTPDYSRAQSWALVNAKSHDSAAWAYWGAQMASLSLADISTLLGSDTVADDLAALVIAIGEIVPPTLGTISGGTGTFSDSLLSDLRARLRDDISTSSTGLGDAEAAIFGRSTNRHNAVRAQAYNETILRFSSAGYRRPPGAVDAKITEASNQSTLELSETNGKILEESTRLALQYNISIIQSSIQLLDLLARVFDSKEAREFEASKTTVMLSLEGYKNYLALMSTKADIEIKKAQIILENKARQLTLEVTTLQSQAQSFMQICASSLNGISSGANFNWSGVASTIYQGT